MGHVLDVIVPLAAAAIGTVVGGPIGGAAGAALGAGGVNYSHTHNFGSALKAGALSGGGSYIGGNIAGNLLGDQLGTVGSALGISGSGDLGAAATGQELGELGGGSSLPWGSIGAGSGDIASALGSGAGRLLSTPISSAVGSAVGNNLASGYASQPNPSTPAAWVPTQAGAASLPGSLNSMSSLTPQQQASGLATQGVYGGGLGPQEQAYYGNLLNRQLVDSGGHYPGSTNGALSPIEQSYNSQLGFGNDNNTYNLLKELNSWNPSA